MDSVFEAMKGLNALLLKVLGVGAGPLAGGGGAFSPLYVSGLKLWLDFSDASTLFTDTARTTPVSADGDLVAGVADKSGNGYHATSAYKPYYYTGVKNGLSALQFAYANLITGSFQSFASKRGAIFVVYKPRFSTASFLAATFNGTSPNYAMYSALSGSKSFFYDGSQRDSSVFDVADAWYVKTIHRDGDTTAKYRRNKTQIDAVTVGNVQPAANPLYVGAATVGNNFAKLMGEILVYDNISAADVLRVESYLYDKWAIGTQTDAAPTTLVGVGDSITAGVGASDAAHRWINLVKAAMGWDVLYNNGVSGTVLQNTTQTTVAVIGGAVSENGRDNMSRRITVYSPDHLFILYGLNDLRLNDAAFTAANFQTDLGEIVDSAIAFGTPAANIVIGSPPYIPAASYALAAPWNGGSALKHADYVAACAAVATAKSTNYIDVYQWMIDNGGDTLIGPDNIHPNDAGHDAIADAFLSVL